MKKFAVITFGCRLNQYQSEKLKEWLSACNLIYTPEPEEADIIIVNGCVVTHKGERDSRKAINKLAKHGKEVIATGCYINLPHVKTVNNVRFLNFNAIKQSFTPIKKPTLHQTRHRVLIGIQAGCDFRCSYCIVPFVRGNARDRKVRDIINEIQAYYGNGTREIVLTGTDIGSFGKEHGTSLIKLIHIIREEFPSLDIRISSILPLYVNSDFISLFKENLVLPHIHLPLQSGSARILRAMRRPYSPEKFEKSFWKIYESNPKMAVGTDIIVGYPEETSHDFSLTYELVRELPFAYIHVFLYSKRPYTKAVQLKELPYDEIKLREKKLLKLAREKKKKFMQKFIGTALSALVEKTESTKIKGTTENYMKFSAINNTDIEPGSRILIKLEGMDDDGVIASIQNTLF